MGGVSFVVAGGLPTACHLWDRFGKWLVNELEGWIFVKILIAQCANNTGEWSNFYDANA